MLFVKRSVTRKKGKCLSEHALWLYTEENEAAVTCSKSKSRWNSLPDINSFVKLKPTGSQCSTRRNSQTTNSVKDRCYVLLVQHGRNMDQHSNKTIPIAEVRSPQFYVV